MDSFYEDEVELFTAVHITGKREIESRDCVCS
jgi:hypothetical protein